VRVAVFAGSSAGRPAHAQAAARFAETLALAGHAVVYGGASVGLMGVAADAALAVGGEVIGVLPEHMVDREIAHGGLTRLEIVAGMHERKARMAELADAFVALPGGAGTLEELFEVWTWGQLGLHAKPVGLLDVDGFYDPLLSQLTVMAEAGYITEVYLAALGVVADADEFLRFVAAYRPPPTGRRLQAAAPEVEAD
jgi:uncharacterized protein (TIGR00730 family)